MLDVRSVSQPVAAQFYKSQTGQAGKALQVDSLHNVRGCLYKFLLLSQTYTCESGIKHSRRELASAPQVSKLRHQHLSDLSADSRDLCAGDPVAGAIKVLQLATGKRCQLAQSCDAVVRGVQLRQGGERVQLWDLGTAHATAFSKDAGGLPGMSQNKPALVFAPA